MSEQPKETSIEKSVESSKAFQDKSQNSEDVHVTTAYVFDLTVLIWVPDMPFLRTTRLCCPRACIFKCSQQ